MDGWLDGWLKQIWMVGWIKNGKNRGMVGWMDRNK